MPVVQIAYSNNRTKYRNEFQCLLYLCTWFMHQLCYRIYWQTKHFLIHVYTPLLCILCTCTCTLYTRTLKFWPPLHMSPSLYKHARMDPHMYPGYYKLCTLKSPHPSLIHTGVKSLNSWTAVVYCLCPMQVYCTILPLAKHTCAYTCAYIYSLYMYRLHSSIGDIYMSSLCFCELLCVTVGKSVYVLQMCTTCICEHIK